MDTKVVVDTLWVLMAGFLVFFMNMGFASVESGFCRAKNCVNIMSKNFVVVAASALGFLILGFGVMFGDGNGFLGLNGLFLLGGADNSPAIADAYQGVYSSISWTSVPLAAKFFFQMVFAGTAATIVSGVVCERIKYVSFIIFTFVMAMVIYPIVGHWIWGGGWLAELGMFDFAGSTVVHSVGGWAGLAGAIILGPRIGKFENGTIKAIRGHNLSLATVGTFVLWFGWFGFNPGSTMAADPGAIAHIALTTNTAAVAAIMSATFFSWWMMGKPDLGMTLNGCLAGLVAITAPCAFVGIGSSIIIGLIAGVLVVVSVVGFDKLHIDDPVGALSVHLVNGVFGTLCVGLFAQDGITGTATGNGLFYGGGFSLLGTQLLGVAAVGGFVLAVSFGAWALIKVVLGVRVSREEELRGLDIGEHGNEAYSGFQIFTTE